LGVCREEIAVLGVGVRFHINSLCISAAA
jgi:hypothetical protein